MRWTTTISALAVVSLLAAAEEPFAISTGPCLQNPGPRSMTVMWLTNRNATGWVEYEPPGGTMQQAATSRHGLIEANQRLHRVVLTNLPPGFRGRYRVCSREILRLEAYKVEYGATTCSAPAELRTIEPATEVSFLVFNDIHENAAVLPQMLAAAGPEPYDLVFFNGDVFDHLDNERQLTGFLGDVARQFASRVPFVWVRGNHEARGPFARRLPDYIALPGGSFYGAFDLGPVHFVVLDTGEDKPDTHEEYSGLADFDSYRREQAQWLREQIRTQAFQAARFRVVLAHMPFAGVASYASRPSAELPAEAHGVIDAWRQFSPLLNQGKVEMMISGHLHSHGIVPPAVGEHEYPIVRGGGPNERNRTVIRVRADQRRLEADILRPGGTVVASTKVAARK